MQLDESKLGEDKRKELESFRKEHNLGDVLEFDGPLDKVREMARDSRGSR